MWYSGISPTQDGPLEKVSPTRVMQQRALLFLALAAAPPSQVKFSKYHGLGNDFILVDDRASKAPSISPAQAMALCDRNFGAVSYTHLTLPTTPYV